MELYHNLVLLIAGVCFFMYGMGLASSQLEILAADHLRILMTLLSRNRLLAIISGILLTVILQSSSAVTVMLVNLASAGVATLSQVMGVIVGSAIGSTVTVQLISMNITQYAPYILISGFGIYFLSKTKKVKEVGAVVFGFGLIFYGLLTMGQAVSVIKGASEFQQLFKFLNENPMSAFWVTTFFTAVVHSSAVTVGLAMTLAASGLISLHDSFYWVAGANLGTTATALLASMNGKHAGKQVAWAHFFYRAAGVTLLLLLTAPFEKLISALTQSPTHQIAQAHTLFNIISAAAFFPFIDLGVVLINKMFPKPSSEKEFGPKYLDPHAYQDPELAFANSVREMLRMTDYAYDMVQKSIFAFEKNNHDLIEEIRTIDKKIDTLNREIKIYLVGLSDSTLNESQKARVVNLIALVSDIENIGDVVDKNILILAQKKVNLKLTFSVEGWKDVQEFHSCVIKNFELAISSLSLGSVELAQKVIDNKQVLRVMEQKMREGHIQRLHLKVQDSLNTSNIHFDLLSSFRRVNSYACNLAYAVLFTDAQTLPSSIDKKVS